jgi:hypothetical protein
MSGGGDEVAQAVGSRVFASGEARLRRNDACIRRSSSSLISGVVKDSRWRLGDRETDSRESNISETDITDFTGGGGLDNGEWDVHSKGLGTYLGSPNTFFRIYRRPNATTSGIPDLGLLENTSECCDILE